MLNPSRRYSDGMSTAKAELSISEVARRVRHLPKPADRGLTSFSAQDMARVLARCEAVGGASLMAGMISAHREWCTANGLEPHF